MRPLSLEIEGLQSFRKAQTIDFEALGAQGLFGIFGPTGSGKSTILDAVTLALYGKVKRADRGTQGIVNSQANQARVSFTFELWHQDHYKRYRVERLYQRKKKADHLCEPKLVRLVALDPQEQVLSDKATEVSAKVEALLGLNHEDFTRAVVLPQNSFQEFLLLDPSKKRGMLERIFYLEAYGRDLLDQLGRAMQALKSQKERLEGQLQAYGDATQERLKGLLEQVEETRLVYEAADAFWQAVEKTYQNEERRWQASLRWNALLAEEAALEKAQTEVDQARTSLDWARKAQALQEPLERLSRQGLTLEGLQRSQNQLKSQAEVWRSEIEKGKEVLAQIQVRLKAQRPLDQQRLMDLGRIVSLSRELEKHREDLARLGLALAKAQRDYQTLEEAARLSQEASLAYGQKLEALQEALKGVQVLPEYRQKVEEGLSLCRVMEEKENKARQLEEEGLSLKEALSLRQKQEEQESRKLQKYELRLEELEAEHKALLEEEGSLLAFALAQTLTEEGPCPVCGSRHHPQLAQPPEGARGDFQKALAEVEERLARGRQMKAQQEQSLAALKAGQALEERQLALQEERLRDLEDGLKREKEVLATRLEALHGVSFAALYEVLQQKDQQAWQLSQALEKLQEQERARLIQGQKHLAAQEESRRQRDNLQLEVARLEGLREEKEQEMLRLIPSPDPEQEKKGLERQIQREDQERTLLMEKIGALEQKRHQSLGQLEGQARQIQDLIEDMETLQTQVEARLKEAGFAGPEEALGARREKTVIEALAQTVEAHQNRWREVAFEKQQLWPVLKEGILEEDQWQRIEEGVKAAKAQREEALLVRENCLFEAAQLEKRLDQSRSLQEDYGRVAQEYDLHDQVYKLLKGDRGRDNSFIDYIAEERLRYVAFRASALLAQMTRHKYALELDAQMGFMVRDDMNGGVFRMITSLSGGELFLTSLSLALALSEQIQLKGQSPLEFFFLDEGFGTLDSDLLDTVMDALEDLSSKERVIGLISHVPEMRSRMARRLMVDSPNIEGQGSRVRLEKA